MAGRRCLGEASAESAKRSECKVARRGPLTTRRRRRGEKLSSEWTGERAEDSMSLPSREKREGAGDTAVVPEESRGRRAGWRWYVVREKGIWRSLSEGEGDKFRLAATWETREDDGCEKETRPQSPLSLLPLEKEKDKDKRHSTEFVKCFKRDHFKEGRRVEGTRLGRRPPGERHYFVAFRETS